VNPSFPAVDSRDERLKPLESFIQIVGRDRAREASDADVVDGVRPALVIEPASIEEAGAVVREAHRSDLAIVPRGLGTKLSWGALPSRVDLIVSTHRMNRVLEHAADDLVARVEGGASLAGVQQVLAQRGQWLAIDPAHAAGTVGGIIAANASGPRRLRYGTMRDLLIGITYILPDGTVAVAGGRVVKNVAGYDICKLFTGSLGTLGLIVEAIVRLHPLPGTRALVSVEIPGGDANTLGKVIQDILNSVLVPSAMTFVVSPEGQTLSALFEGIEAGVEAQVRGARVLLEKYGHVHLGDVPGDDLVEPAPGSASPEARACLAITTSLADLPHAIEAVRSVAWEVSGQRAAGSAAPAVIHLDVRGQTPTVVLAIKAIRRELASLEAHVVVREASPDIKRAVDVWGPVGDSLALMQSVKRRYDPTGIMSPGRFVGGL